MPFAGNLGNASPSDIASVCSSLPQLLDYKSISSQPTTASAAEDNCPYTDANDQTSGFDRESALVLAQNPSLFQPVMMIASSAASAFDSMSGRQLYQTVIGLASVGFPAGPSWLDSHARAVAAVAILELDQADIDAIEVAYARMRRMRARLRGSAKAGGIPKTTGYLDKPKTTGYLERKLKDI